MKVIDLKIKSAEVVKQGAAARVVTHMSENVARPDVLTAKVYKIKPGDHAFYICVSDVTLNEGTPDEVTRPYELFINTKDMSAFQWIAGLSRMISAVMRKGGDITFIVEELKSVFDPAGGHWSDGKYIPSVAAHIGMVLEQHLIKLGLLKGEAITLQKESSSVTQASPAVKGSQCSKCKDFAVVKEDGCEVCKSCGNSKCG